MTVVPQKAAQYLRMSTDSQDLSPEMQRAAIESYAQCHDIAIVETYLDAGKSGLTLNNRPAMKRLLADVGGGNCPFGLVLVYDISRWGRFQDTDASAYYEYHCRLNGVDVHYVQEPFGQNDSPVSALFKNFKRLMAAEYSRELSIKTVAGHTAALEQGFQLGTLPCLGLVRVAVSKADGSQRTLRLREHKSARGEHVRWTLGPEHEVQTVRRIFQLYVHTELSVVKLAELLRDEGVCTGSGQPITQWMLYRLLRCESLTGDFVWGRENSRQRRAPDDTRIRRKTGALPAIVDRELFEAAQVKMNRRQHFIFTPDILLEQLRSALQRNPRLNGSQLKRHGCACRETFVKHFGSLKAAWEAAGSELHTHAHQDGAIGASLRAGSQLCQNIARMLAGTGIQCTFYKRADRNGQTLLLNGRTILRTQVVRKEPRYETNQWHILLISTQK